MELDCGSHDFNRLQKIITEFEKIFDQLCEKLSDKYYSDLETEYDYQNADAQVDESIEANDYTFTETGKRF